MTDAVKFLLSAAKDAQDYAMRKWNREPDKGQYDGLSVARALSEAIRAVEAEDAQKAHAA